MSTPSNRWLFLAVLPLSFATMVFIDHLTDLTTKDLLWLVGASIGLIFVVWLTQGFTLHLNKNDLMNYGILLLILLLLVTARATHLKSTTFTLATSLIVFISLINGGQGWMNPLLSANTSRELNAGSATKWLHNYYDGANNALRSDNSFYRTDTMRNYYPYRAAGNDIPGFLGTHDLNSYYSIQNGYLFRFNQSIDNAQSVANAPTSEGDNRTTLLNLLGVRYLFAKSDILKQPSAIPYGFKLMKTRQGKIIEYRDKQISGLSNHSGTVILKSDLALPLVYLQNQTISKQRYEQLNPIQREQSLLQGAQVNQNVAGIPSIKPTTNVKNVAYTPVLKTKSILNSGKKVALHRVYKTSSQHSQQVINKRVDEIKSRTIQVQRPDLKKVIRTNQQVIKENKLANRSSLHLMSTDAEGRHLSYRLKVKYPQQLKNSELYLVINGAKGTKNTTGDFIDHFVAQEAVNGLPISKVKKAERTRTALRFPDLGAYTLSANTSDSFNYYHQLPTNNLSDFDIRHNTVLNLGYSKTPRKQVKLQFTVAKSLHFKSVRLMAVTFNPAKYQQQIKKLQRQGLQHLSVKNDRITGMAVSPQHKSILTTSIPYTSGWQLKVDGKVTPTYLVNKGFVGATIPKGKHQITLTYKTPGLKLGKIISIIGIIWLLGAIIVHLVYKPKNLNK